ncbi:MAG: hypothetical protein C5B50_24270 [Verrucomicrobia bacterium]|nr:MAG: hypothetical protein C5B50_24270 [Verrucomicrobiota bacterium]
MHETPNTKLQNDTKLQASNARRTLPKMTSSAWQTAAPPSRKDELKDKLKSDGSDRSVIIGTRVPRSLEFGVSLVFGAWCLVFV